MRSKKPPQSSGIILRCLPRPPRTAAQDPAFGDRLQAKCGDQLGDQGHEYLERILASAGRMRTLINDLLTFARVTTKAQPLVRTSLTTVAQEAVSDLENRIQQTGGRVDVAELPTLDADPSQMRQMLQNSLATD